MCLACSDMSTFFEDIKVARPTSLFTIPRIANMLFDQVQEQIRKAKGTNKQVCLTSFTAGHPGVLLRSRLYHALKHLVHGILSAVLAPACCLPLHAGCMKMLCEKQLSIILARLCKQHGACLSS